jgi:hypothetical protein
MAAEHDPASAPEPDDLDRQLRELTSGVAQAPKFTEPSAAERARQAARRANAHPAGKPGARPRGWRTARKARGLRRPVSEPGRAGRQGRLRSAGAGSRPAARSPRAQRIRSAARTAAIVIGFAVLLFVLHVLGFGPQ